MRKRADWFLYLRHAAGPTVMFVIDVLIAVDLVVRFVRGEAVTLQLVTQGARTVKSVREFWTAVNKSKSAPPDDQEKALHG